MKSGYKKKIAFLINNFYAGGAERTLSIIIEKLKEDFEIDLICLEKRDFYTVPEKVKRVYLSTFTGNECTIVKMLYLPIFAWKLKNYTKRNNIELVQSHLFRANFINILSKIFGGRHKTQIVNSTLVSRYLKKGLSGKVNLILIKLLYPKADLVIWKSKGMKKDANKLFKLKTKQIIINNPIDVDKVQKLSKDRVTEFYFRKDKSYLVSVGRLIKLKRRQDIIRVLPLLPNKVELILIGDGVEKNNLLKLSKELGVKSRVHFIGNTANPFKFLSKSDVFVNTSEVEGFPNVLIEAMACGLPVISSDCTSGPREILAPDTDINKQLVSGNGIELAKYGILYPTGDEKSLFEAIDTLLNNRDLRDKYSKLGVLRAKDFSAERIVPIYKKVIIETLKSVQ